jgi:hypothetical protein
MLHANQLVPN